MWQTIAPFRGMIFGALIAAVGLGLMLGSTVPFNTAKRLAETGVEVTATVIDRWTAEDDDKTTYTLRYQFSHNDMRHTDRRGVPIEFFDAHPIDATFPMLVHPDDANTHEVFHGELITKARNILLGGTFFTGFGALFLFLTNLKRLKNHKAAAEQDWPDV